MRESARRRPGIDKLMSMPDAERSRFAEELKRAFESASAPDANSGSRPDPMAKEGSISFTMPLLKAVLAGQKTQTRRPIRPMPATVVGGVALNSDDSPIAPLAAVGDRLWIREKWARLDDGSFVYAVDEPQTHPRWIASRFMPRAAARHWVLINRVAIARLSEMTDADARAEGAGLLSGGNRSRDWFVELWDSIYGEGEFASANDPWVWTIAFSLKDE